VASKLLADGHSMPETQEHIFWVDDQCTELNIQHRVQLQNHS